MPAPLLLHPPQEGDSSQVPMFALLSQGREGRLPHRFPHSLTWAHPSWGQLMGEAEGQKRESPGGRRQALLWTVALAGLSLLVPSGHLHQPQVTVEDSDMSRKGHLETGSEQGAAADTGLQGHQHQPQPARRVGRVAHGVNHLHPSGAQQAAAVVGEGVEGELAVVAAHPAGTCAVARNMTVRPLAS